jgi:translation elongation factor EF-G
LTAGEGDYSFHLSHYDPVPNHLASDIIQKSQKSADGD